ncbi:MAG: SBBP repeat-containing protein [Bacteroidales bacterium]|nr:SBBP repeat-containing protein [Bacteroidales bacterium]
MKKNNFLCANFLLILMLISSSLSAQNATLEWAKQFEGVYSNMPLSIAVDASGNVYTTGVFEGTVDFDPGPGNYFLSSAGGEDIFISKLDASGNFVWAIQMGSSNDEFGSSITVDGSQNIVLTGGFQGTVDFDSGPNTHLLTSTGDVDIFICKLTPSGDFIWAKNMGGGGLDQSNFITTDHLGNIYTTGYFMGTADFDPGVGSLLLTATGANSVFISKLDSSGEFVWAKMLDGTGQANGTSLAIDTAGNIHITGNFSGNIDFDPGSGTFILSAIGGTDIFIVKLTSTGNLVWAKSIGGNDSEQGLSIATDASGNVYTTGQFRDTVNFDPGCGIFNLYSLGQSDIFISKLDISGNFVWAKQMGGPSGDVARSIIFDKNNNIYTTGYFAGTADFDPGTGNYNLTSAGYLDAFFLKLDANGDFVWAKQIEGSGIIFGLTMAMDVSGNIYGAGIFQGTPDFDPNNGTFNMTSGGDYDSYVMKLNQIVGVDENNSSKQNIILYPNPTTGSFFIDLRHWNNRGTIHVKNMLGQNIISVPYIPNTINELNISDGGGVYFVEIISFTREKAVRKILKQ